MKCPACHDEADQVFHFWCLSKMEDDAGQFACGYVYCGPEYYCKTHCPVGVYPKHQPILVANTRRMHHQFS